MDPIKEAFQKAKQDIQFLKSALSEIQSQIQELKSLLESNKPSVSQSNNQSIQHIIPQQTPLQQTFSEENPTEELNELEKELLYGPKSPISSFSTGNRGVPTDRQTNQQTVNRQTDKPIIDDKLRLKEIQRVSELLDSLDELKQEVRLKFKHLTKQEMLVFSTVYQLEEQSKSPCAYTQLAQKLALSESSIRDYTQRMIKKGIPLIKTKENNKKVFVSIAPELKKIASLSTIMHLREL